MIVTPINGYSGLFTTVHNQAALSTIGIRSNAEKAISMELRSKGDRSLRRLVRTLNGVVAGTTATETFKRIKSKAGIPLQSELGGLVEIETFNLVNRATTAADITNFTNVLDERPAPTYPVDLSGNGGGGKLGR